MMIGRKVCFLCSVGISVFIGAGLAVWRLRRLLLDLASDPDTTYFGLLAGSLSMALVWRFLRKPTIGRVLRLGIMVLAFLTPQAIMAIALAVRASCVLPQPVPVWATPLPSRSMMPIWR